MVARRRLLSRIKEVLAVVGLLLLYTVGLPWLATLTRFERPWLTTIAQAGRWLLVAAPVLVILGSLWQWRQVRQRQAAFHHQLATEGLTYLLLPRADAPTVKADKVSFWARLAGLIPAPEHIAWELIGGPEGLVLALRATPAVAQALMAQVAAEWPGTQARLAPDPLQPLTGQPTWWCEVVAKQPDAMIQGAASDPLFGLLGVLAQLPTGVHAGLQLLVRDDPFSRTTISHKAAKAAAEQTTTYAGKTITLADSLERKRTARELDHRAQRRFWEVCLLVWATAETEDLARHTAQTLAQALIAEAGPANPLHPHQEGAGLPAGREFPALAGRPWTDEELGRLAHLVGADALVVAPHLQTAPARPLSPTPPCLVPPTAICSRAVAELLAASLTSAERRLHDASR